MNETNEQQNIYICWQRKERNREKKKSHTKIFSQEFTQNLWVLLAELLPFRLLCGGFLHIDFFFSSTAFRVRKDEFVRCLLCF